MGLFHALANAATPRARTSKRPGGHSEQPLRGKLGAICTGHQRKHRSVYLLGALGGLAMRSHSCRFLPYLLEVPLGMSRDRRTLTRMSERYTSHWHDSTSSGPTTGRVGWQHRPMYLAS